MPHLKEEFNNLTVSKRIEAVCSFLNAFHSRSNTMRLNRLLWGILPVLISSACVLADKTTQHFLDEGNVFLASGKFNDALENFDAAIGKASPSYASPSNLPNPIYADPGNILPISSQGSFKLPLLLQTRHHLPFSWPQFRCPGRLFQNLATKARFWTSPPTTRQDLSQRGAIWVGHKGLEKIFEDKAKRWYS